MPSWTPEEDREFYRYVIRLPNTKYPVYTLCFTESIVARKLNLRFPGRGFTKNSVHSKIRRWPPKGFRL